MFFTLAADDMFFFFFFFALDCGVHTYADEASVVLAPCGPNELDQTEELQPPVLSIMTLGRVGG